MAATDVDDSSPYPIGLLDWAGNQAGGVRRLFDEDSGRPTDNVIHTPLLSRLRDWAQLIAASPSEAPRIVLLVGGPGNGKTEAVEATIGWLDSALGAGGRLVGELSRQLIAKGQVVPRVASAQFTKPGDDPLSYTVQIVQDASVEDPPGASRARLFAEELGIAIASGEPTNIYLACVNRGVLDDALIHVSENGPADVRALLHSIIEAGGLSGSEASCWPLKDFDDVAIWPMDVESIFQSSADGSRAPAIEILARALDEEKWPRFGSCPAGRSCPYCTSRRLLAGRTQGSALLSILRWHELATAKRWTFRDFFSLVAYLLADSNATANPGKPKSPCSWAASLSHVDSSLASQRPDGKRSSAAFLLAGSLYQHRLFSRWDATAVRQLRADFSELGYQDDHTATGLVAFLKQGWGIRPPAMIEGLLESLCEALDPAMADPDLQVVLSTSKSLRLRDIDANFSQSVASGLSLLQGQSCLAPMEADVLGRLAELDRSLSTPARRRKRPEVATRVQHLLREFSCRFARRSLGARFAVTRDKELLEDFQRIVAEGGAGGDHLRTIAREFGRLLNSGEKFNVSLTTTFGQPAPPVAHRAVLVAAKQSVKAKLENTTGRPLPPVRTLRVGRAPSEQNLPLTFELYRSIRSLEAGLSWASLPTEVNALIDATKARLSGPIVRDEVGLEDSVIELGDSSTRIELVDGRFVVIQSED